VDFFFAVFGNKEMTPINCNLLNVNERAELTDYLKLVIRPEYQSI